MITFCLINLVFFQESSPVTNGTSTPKDSARDANWFDVGIIKGSSCTVSSYYLPSGDGERPEIDVEGNYLTARSSNMVLAY